MAELLTGATTCNPVAGLGMQTSIRIPKVPIKGKADVDAERGPEFVIWVAVTMRLEGPELRLVML